MSEGILKKLESAIRLTHPDYGASNLLRIITHEEATALNNIAVIYSEMGKTDYTIKVLYHLKDFYEHDVLDSSESIRTLPIADDIIFGHRRSSGAEQRDGNVRSGAL